MSGRHEHAELPTPALPDAVDVYDTTLRDGSQQEGLSLTVDDRRRGHHARNAADNRIAAPAPGASKSARHDVAVFGGLRGRQRQGSIAVEAGQDVQVGVRRAHQGRVKADRVIGGTYSLTS